MISLLLAFANGEGGWEAFLEPFVRNPTNSSIYHLAYAFPIFLFPNLPPICSAFTPSLFSLVSYEFLVIALTFPSEIPQVVKEIFLDSVTVLSGNFVDSGGKCCSWGHH